MYFPGDYENIGTLNRLRAEYERVEGAAALNEIDVSFRTAGELYAHLFDWYSGAGLLSGYVDTRLESRKRALKYADIPDVKTSTGILGTGVPVGVFYPGDLEVPGEYPPDIVATAAPGEIPEISGGMRGITAGISIGSAVGAPHYEPHVSTVGSFLKESVLKGISLLPPFQLAPTSISALTGGASKLGEEASKLDSFELGERRDLSDLFDPIPSLFPELPKFPEIPDLMGDWGNTLGDLKDLLIVVVVGYLAMKLFGDRRKK